MAGIDPDQDASGAASGARGAEHGSVELGGCVGGGLLLVAEGACGGPVA
jgi:hypothetical protein